MTLKRNAKQRAGGQNNGRNIVITTALYDSRSIQSDARERFHGDIMTAPRTHNAFECARLHSVYNTAELDTTIYYQFAFNNNRIGIKCYCYRTATVLVAQRPVSVRIGHFGVCTVVIITINIIIIIIIMGYRVIMVR